MFSIRKQLCVALHCFLHLLYFSTLIVGEIDTAFVDIATEDGENGLNTTLIGKFARIGSIRQVEGELRKVRLILINPAQLLLF